MAGKLFVFEGLDSTGKATQTRFLVERLKKLNHVVETIDFPQYGTWNAVFVEKYLNGEFGEDVDPYQASLFYALDRYALKNKLVNWLSQEKIVIANRYVAANQAYQGGKLSGKEREDFLFWLDDIEHNKLQLPRPDAVLYLRVPLAISQDLLEKRKQKEYIKDGNKDIHEKNLQLLKSTQEVYEELSETKSWHIIECTENNKLLYKEDVHERVWEKVKTLM